MLNGLDLFSGGGGLAEGLHKWVRPVAYCEVEPGAQRVLLSRMARGELPRAPIWDDVRTLRGSAIPSVDIIAGGFPCQDISVAGTGAGLGGDRSGLVFEYLRLIGECRPRFVFMENVPALTIRGLDAVLLGLYALGYDARWAIVSAAEMGAAHIRERIWILAHSDNAGRFGSDQLHIDAGRAAPMQQWADTLDLAGFNGGSRDASQSPEGFAEPRVCRTGDGMADRVNRLRILGNGVVPLCATEAFMRLIGLSSLDSAERTGK